MLDIAVTGLQERFHQNAGMQIYGKLEKVLLTTEDTIGDVGIEAVTAYPEINVTDLKVQLAMFHRNYTIETVSEAASVFGKMIPEVRLYSFKWKLCYISFWYVLLALL